MLRSNKAKVIYETYDDNNRLIREDNQKLNETIIYQYDTSGNIVKRKIYDYTLEEQLGKIKTKNEYRYTLIGWKDKLETYNNQQIVYDNMGYPTTYKGEAMSWENGRLQSYKGVSNTYNLDGIRTSKIVNGITTKYYIMDSKIHKIVDSQGNTMVIYYTIDKMTGFSYNGDVYYYVRNIQGDITHIYKSDNTLVCEYIYDAYGNHKVKDGQGEENISDTFIGNINPFRYRGYFYDRELKLYYLNERYYDSETCRFISPDSVEYLNPESINGLNLYAYCGNNPVNYSDGSGHFPILCTLLFLGGLGALTSIASQAVTDIMYGNEFDINNYLIAAGAGFLGGLCYAIPVAGGFLAGAVTSGLTTAGQMIYSGEDYNVEDYIINIGVSAAVGGLTSVAFGKATSKLSYFADTDFFLSNLVKFAGNHGGITLQNSVINQLMGQLIVRGVVTGTISNMFGSIFQEIPSKSSDYFHLRKMGLNRWDSFRYAFF